MAKGTIIAGLDIGSSKISVVVGHTAPNVNKQMEIIGVGTVNSEGLQKGVIVDINLTAEAIREAISDAELMAGIKIEAVCVGISGDHVVGQTSHGMVTVASPAEITGKDVERAMTAAEAHAIIPENQHILHVIEQNFIIDKQNKIKEPIGMSGSRLEAYAYIITGSISAIQNLLNSVEKAGIPTVETLAVAPLASGYGVLTRDEIKVGSALVDIGDQTTEIIVYKEDAIEHTAVFPFGGQHVTNDIAQCLKVTLPAAEELKLHKGCAYTEWLEDDGTHSIQISSGSNRPRFINRLDLAEVIQYRMVEMLEYIAHELGDMQLPGGLVLTGGTALMEGLPELAEQIIPLRVQVGYPKTVGGLTDRVNYPMYATSLGLVLYGEYAQQAERHARSSQRGTGPFNRLVRHIKEWFGY